MSSGFKQWDIVKVRIVATDRDEHSAILLSPQEAIDAQALNGVVVIYGTTKRANHTLKPGQIYLNGSDGLDHITVFDMLQLHMVPKQAIRKKIGTVTPERLRILKRTIVSTFRLTTT